MLFDQNDISTRYIDKHELREYLITTLRERLGFEYEVFIRNHIGSNTLTINIDETTMSHDSYTAIQNFMRIHDLACDLDILTHFIKEAAPKHRGGNRIEISYLVPDLEGVYVIRDQMQDELDEEYDANEPIIDGPGMAGGTGQ